jgi:hypothetical protein
MLAKFERVSNMAEALEITGLEELRELLSEDRLRRTTKRYLTVIESKAAQPVIDAMKAAVPDESGKGTGHMADTIGRKSRWRSSADGEQLQVKIGPGTEPYPRGKAADIIAFFLEFGANTRLGKTISGVVRSHRRRTAASHEQDTIPATHFLYGAWQSSKDACFAAFNEAARELVERFKN